MTTIALDAVTLAKLRAGGGTVLVTDESGTLYGEFNPRPNAADYAALGRNFATEAELEAHLATVKLIPAAEVEQRLKELRKCS